MSALRNELPHLLKRVKELLAKFQSSWKKSFVAGSKFSGVNSQFSGHVVWKKCFIYFYALGVVRHGLKRPN